MRFSEDEGELELHPLVDSINEASPADIRQSIETDIPPISASNERYAKIFALVLACTFSVGSQYSQDCIGPLKDILKSELYISDSQISLILGSNLVSNTIVPIIAGVLVARFGTLKSSIFATTIVFLGQLINLLAVIWGSADGMIFGLCLFG